MRMVFITPCKDCLLVEFREKASFDLNNIIRQTDWLKWKQMNDVNGKGRLQWYVVVDTTSDKDKRLKYIAKILCEDENYVPSSRICPHDLYYEDYVNYFDAYCNR